MTAAVAGTAKRERLYLQSGGNPLYLEQLVRSARRPTLAEVSGLAGRGARAALGGRFRPL